MKLILSFLMAGSIITAGLAYSQELPPNVSMNLTDKEEEAEKIPAPSFKALNGLAYNAGEVQVPAQLSRDFSFKNEGDAPLEIKEVRTGCSCLAANYVSLIQPGETGVINISMALHPEWEGREISRTTWVMTNDPKQSQIRLTMSAKALAAEK